MCEAQVGCMPGERNGTAGLPVSIGVAGGVHRSKVVST